MKILQLEQPEKAETPDWVKHFVDFICSKSLEDWQDKKGFYQRQENKDLNNNF